MNGCLKALKLNERAADVRPSTNKRDTWLARKAVFYLSTFYINSLRQFLFYINRLQQFQQWLSTPLATVAKSVINHCYILLKLYLLGSLGDVASAPATLDVQ